MNLLRLTACTLFLCFTTSCEAAQADIDKIIGGAAEALEKDWTNQDEVIIRLIDRVDKIEKSVGECENRLKKFDNQLNAIEKEQKSISDGIKQQAIRVTKCCSGAPPGERILTVDVDDSFTLYLDGKEIKGFKHANDWRIADSTPLPSDTKVIAVKGKNAFGDPGVLASTEDGYVLTNTTWKCSNEEVKGWETAGFDDSEWPNAFVVLPARKKPIKGIRDDTSWIWTKNFHYLKGDKIVYCRLKLQ